MKRPKRIEIDGISFDALTADQALDILSSWLSGRVRRQSYRVVKPYVEFFKGVRQDRLTAEAINTADLVLADSVAVQWAGAWLAEPSPTWWRWVWSWSVGLRRPDWLERIIPARGSGADSAHRWLVEASQNGWRVGILGGPADIGQTERAIKELYPILQLAGVWSGFGSSRSEPKLIESIKSAKVDILFVALGFPRQEKWMLKHYRQGLARVMVGEGGTFDYDTMGGDLKRAPGWMQRVGLEWLWRLMLQPHRFKRQLEIPRFMRRIYRLSRQDR